MTREELLDLLTDAATIGRNGEIAEAGTRGDIKAYIERRMKYRIAGALGEED